MANISDKTNLTNHTGVVNEAGVAGANWISQINAGGTVYDIATHHGITFREGSGGATTTWNGLSDIEVVIPSITDIVQTPIEFVGVVGANGEIDWKNGHSAPAKAGNLVFIASDCTFNSIACEAGDMAIYDGEKWNVVTGENQVQLVGSTDKDNRITVAVGAAADVLTVEGKTLALTLDYTELDKHVTLTPGGKVNVDFTKVTVDDAYVKLTQANDTPLTVGVDTSFELPTKLTNGNVELKNATGLVNNITWGTFTQGTQTDSSKNSEKKLDITGGSLTLSSGNTTGHFVDGVSMGDVTFEVADESDTNKIKAVTGLVAGTGASFLSDIHTTREDETADLTIVGYIAPTNINVTFVEGLKEGNPVKNITAGNFKLKEGSDLATGFGEESTSGEVISKVTVTANNNTSVLSSATVNGHVLEFNATNVTSGVDVDCMYKSLTKTGFEYTKPEAVFGEFVTSGFEKVDDVKYTFGRGNETTYTPNYGMWKLNTPDIVTTMGTYTLDRTNMKATVPAQTFVTSVTPGDLPTWTGYDFDTVNVTGTVETALTTETKTLHVVDSDITTITIPGKYSLTSATAAGDNTVLVGKAGDAKTTTATVDLTGYITDVTIS